MDDEINGLATAIDMLKKVFLFINIERLWSPNPKGQFSVRSLYYVLIGEQAIVLGWNFYWHKLIPPRVAVFVGW